MIDLSKVKFIESLNFSKRNQQISAIIIHHTSDFNNNVNYLTSITSRVSSHYVIYTTGEIIQLVKVKDKAWHAGKSILFGDQDVNEFSIGIELVGDGNEREFTKEQLNSCGDVCLGLAFHFDIPLNRIVGHEHISPGRKVDPGKFFPWKEFLLDIAYAWSIDNHISVGGAELFAPN